MPAYRWTGSEPHPSLGIAPGQVVDIGVHPVDERWQPVGDDEPAAADETPAETEQQPAEETLAEPQPGVTHVEASAVVTAP